MLLTSGYGLPGPLQGWHRRTGSGQRGLFLLVPPPFLSLGLMFVFLACDSPAEAEADTTSHTEQQQCEFHPKQMILMSTGDTKTGLMHRMRRSHDVYLL